MPKNRLKISALLGGIFVLIVLLFISFVQPEEQNAEKKTEEAQSKNLNSEKIITEKLAEILKSDILDGAITSIHVRKADDAAVVYESFGNTNLHPASNMKIITAVAALEVLGEDYRFTTEILTDGEIADKTLTGDLYINGKGDPTLTAEALKTMVNELKEKGIERITGDIIADDTWYDDVRYSPDLTWSDEYNYTGAAISALTLSPNEDYDAGTVQIFVGGTTGIGETAEITVNPENDYVKIKNNATVVAGPEAEGITIDRKHGTNEIIVEGSIGVDKHVAYWRSVWEPTNYVLHVFAQVLEAEGIKVEGKTKVAETPESADVIIARESETLGELIISFMKYSNNTIGEILVKEMGKFVHDEGSWEKGMEVVEEALAESFEIAPEKIFLRDGSGMSLQTLVSGNVLTRILATAQEKDWYELFKASLPVAGVDKREIGGTLAHRMKEEPLAGKVLAKTGSLTGVNTLAGYFTGASGEEYIFSILVNNYRSGYVPKLIDQMMEVLVEEL